jgi:hypothetical protein
MEMGSGTVCIYRSLESSGQVCDNEFGRNLALVAMKMFPHVIYFIKKFHKFCTLNVICMDNTSVNCITLQHEKGLFPLTLTGHTMLFYLIPDSMVTNL